MQESKKCRKCKITKPIEQYYKHPTCKFGVRGTCKKCNLDKRNTVFKDRQLWKRYKIRLKDYNDMLSLQDNKCAICRKDQADLKVSLAVDHCHSTGAIRGLLCYNCNMGIGRLQDDVSLLKNAIEYLSAY